ncbi:hypothetical protein FB451DRAFT_1272139 [Mycena latifolia]|nr:hypothetical protein FB451DRAFT_1272139 [Mycena latifolia]
MPPYRFPPLPDDQTAVAPPPPDLNRTWIYGYKILDDFDEKIDAHVERVGSVMCATTNLGHYVQIFSNYSKVMLSLAVYEPEFGIVTTRGGTRIPCEGLLQKLQRDINVDGGPTWHLDDGTFFGQGYTAKDWIRRVRPTLGLWTMDEPQE